ncbi:VPLPA-CTERM sorting domain-containing protein [Thiohalobacter sp. IOR34]|uniref:VPLPA-CTERM sorting domain-containing protein n=1 Tax=Thiohalobacter sp. IOR34 TaxID=3057176 RepID=UPI0025B0AADE|nr:VPLPA-CTERM sorting domain-containing protein [Thiohalobacter sp. IOR34]WJW74269.1 VPLPA-CTERM sorting domain-containing protein [Thiohalobacter sp. IOR34]
MINNGKITQQGRLRAICGLAGLITAGATGTASADIINFSFTGRLTIFVANSSTDITSYSIISGSDTSLDPYGYQTPIAANLTVDTTNGSGFSDLTFSFNFWDQPVTIHDINLSFSGNSMISGNMLADWNGTIDNPISILWDATGLFNAIDYGLQAGDKISGTRLYRDFDGDGVAESFLVDVNSALPWSDAWTSPENYQLNQGPAPIATAPGVFGITDGPFTGLQLHLDIGSGNSLYVQSVQTVVPLPAAIWLFGSGLAGLAGMSLRRKLA